MTMTKRSASSSTTTNDHDHGNEPKKLKLTPFSSHILPLLSQPHLFTQQYQQQKLQQNEQTKNLKNLKNFKSEKQQFFKQVSTETPPLKLLSTSSPTSPTKLLTEIFPNFSDPHNFSDIDRTFSKQIFQFLSVEDLVHSVGPTCKTLYTHVHYHIEKLFLSAGPFFRSEHDLLQLLRQFPNIGQLVMDGFDSISPTPTGGEINNDYDDDEEEEEESVGELKLSIGFLSSVMQQAQWFNTRLSELTLQQCQLPGLVLIDGSCDFFSSEKIEKIEKSEKSANEKNGGENGEKSENDDGEENEGLSVLRLDHLRLTEPLIRIESRHLRKIEFFDVNFDIFSRSSSKMISPTTTALIQLEKCVSIESLLFHKCTHFTDRVLHQFLTCFLSESIKRRIELAHSSQNRSIVTSTSNTTSKMVDVDEHEGENEENREKNGNEGDKEEKIGSGEKNGENVDHQYRLRQLVLIECEPLTNPIIQSETLQELRMIRCKHLLAPLISCIQLRKLQLNWCERLQNLTMAAPNLKFLDLNGVGTSTGTGGGGGSGAGAGHEVTRNNIISAVKQFNPNIHISY